MPVPLTKKLLLARRAARYRRRMDIRVTTLEQAVEFVNDVGFCFLFPIQNVEMPSLWDAVAGRVVKTSSKHSGYEIERTWGWKDQSLGKKWWYYGKLLRSKATLVSLSLLPNFYALSGNFGDDDDYLQDYDAGQLSWEARNIFEALLKGGAMDTVRLRRESHLSAESAKATFERALVELQIGMRVLPVGVAEAGAWRYAFIYDLVTRHFPQLSAQARSISRREARRNLLTQFLFNNVVASRKDIERVFSVLKWTSFELENALEEMLAAQLVAKVRVEGLRGEQFVSLNGS
jgi:hypothetical protein